MNYAEAAWSETKAKAQGFEIKLLDVVEKANQSWGKTIANWALDSKSTQLERLLAYQDSLILVTLSVEQSLPEETSFIYVARDGLRQDARKAYFVAPAMNTDQRIPGETYYFRTATGKLRSGMRVDVWVPETSEPINGVFIPEEAIVWYAGQAWTYIKLDEGRFQRRSLKHSLKAEGGLLVQQDIDVGETLVMTGSQMLLSEEFKWQIQDEDDD